MIQRWSFGKLLGVRRDVDATLPLFDGPRKLTSYDAKAIPQPTKGTSSWPREGRLRTPREFNDSGKSICWQTRQFFLLPRCDTVSSYPTKGQIMKVIVIGATGTIGSLAVRQMLAAEHDVSAFSRNPEKLAIEHPKLALAPGDVQDQKQVDAAVTGKDAVVITLGNRSLVSPIRSEGALNVIRAMQKTGVKRLICQSTLGAHESWSNLNFFWKRIMFGGILRNVFRDHEMQERLVEASGLDWTIVRPGAFIDGPATGTFKEAFPPTLRGLRLKISRNDIANFLTRQLTEDRYLQRAVAISN